MPIIVCRDIYWGIPSILRAFINSGPRMYYRDYGYRNNGILTNWIDGWLAGWLAGWIDGINDGLFGLLELKLHRK